jgi:hypothetical protein
METNMTIWRSLTITVMMFAWCSITLATDERAKVAEVKSCRGVPRTPPITRRCVAAAIAEDAYLKAADHDLTFHRIYFFKSSKTEWRFVIQEGDEAHPPAEGAEWFIRVDRDSGKVTVDPGR